MVCCYFQQLFKLAENAIYQIAQQTDAIYQIVQQTTKWYHKK
jgi:hypothetical protein